MGYLHIDNLYKNRDITLFRECYALEKIHGTSAHISWTKGEIHFSSGGESYERFKGLFDVEKLIKQFELSVGQIDKAVIYGEAYGGSQQKMAATYGPNLKFVAFDVMINDMWLSVPQADEFVKAFDIEFVWYTKVSTDIDELDKIKDLDSVQAVRNGVGSGKKMEGIVLRPLIEVTKNNGARIIVKHKRDDFKETASARSLETDPNKLEVLKNAESVAEEWVTPMRLTHVLDKMPGFDISKLGMLIRNMQEDIKREGAGEIEWSKDIEKSIGKATVSLYKMVCSQ